MCSVIFVAASIQILTLSCMACFRDDCAEDWGVSAFASSAARLLKALSKKGLWTRIWACQNASLRTSR